MEGRSLLKVITAFSAVGIPPLSMENCSKTKNRVNIGRLVDELLEGYDSNILPSPSGVDTTIEIHVQAVSSLSELTSDFELDIMYSEIWTDHRLSFANLTGSGQPGDCVKNVTLKPEVRNKIWKPDTCIVNSKDSMIHKSPSENVFVILHEDGKIWSNYRMKVKGPCHLDMKMFPFDLVSCKLVFESYSFNADEVRLSWDNVPVTFMDTVDLPELTMLGWKANHKRLPYPNGIWDRLELILVFKRRYETYLFQAYFPTTLTVLSAWVGLLMDVKTIAARTTLGISSLLAMIFQFGTLLRQLPKVSYIKCLDVWMIACVLFIFMTLIQLALVYSMAIKERNKQLKQSVVGRWLTKARKTKQNKESTTRKQLEEVAAQLPKQPSTTHAQIVSVSMGGEGAEPVRKGGWAPPPESHCLLIERDCKHTSCDWDYLVPMTPWWSQSVVVGKGRNWLKVIKQRFYAVRSKTKKIKLTAKNVDRATFFGFPLLFAIFNTCYWGYYITSIEDGTAYNISKPLYIMQETVW